MELLSTIEMGSCDVVFFSLEQVEKCPEAMALVSDHEENALSR
jgi:hypothetical protein